MKKKKKIRLVLLGELLAFLLCVGLGIYFVWVQQCQWESVLAVVWGLSLLILFPCLMWAEWRVYQRRNKESWPDRRS